MDVRQINVLVFAYIGDAIYELYIREYLITKSNRKVNELQKLAVNFVNAKSQAIYLSSMIKDDYLNKEELEIVKRARNNKSSNHPRNTDVVTYKNATGLEALIGYLYLVNEKERIEGIMNYIFNIDGGK